MIGPEFNESEIMTNEIKKFKLLKNAFFKLYDAEEKAVQIRKENYIKLAFIEDLNNETMNQINKTFAEEMKKIENKQEEIFGKKKSLICPLVEQYPKMILEKYPKVGEGKKIMDDARMISEQQSQNKREEERFNDNKCLLLHFIYSELAFHTNAVNNLLELIQTMSLQNPLLKLEEFATKWDIPIPEEIAIEINNCKREVEKKKREREKIDMINNDVSKDNIENDEDDEA